MLALLLACAQPDDAGVAAPTIAWLTPADGARVAAGELSCATIVEGASLVDPAKHNDGAPIGFLRVSVDDAVVLETGATTFTLSLDPGPHTLHAALHYADADPVTADAAGLCTDADPTCVPVTATVDVTAE